MIDGGAARILLGACLSALAIGAALVFWAGWEAALWRRSDDLRAEGRAALLLEISASSAQNRIDNREAAFDAGMATERDLGELDPDGRWRERLRELCAAAPADCGLHRLRLDEAPELQP